MAASVQTSQKINELYVFGDSLSHVGKIFHATGGTNPSSPPYFQGRYSNGLVWVEHLASNLALTLKPNTNFACGGATTASGSINGKSSLLAQVNSFTKAHPKVNANALYVLWAGANEYLYGASDPTQSIENLSKAVQSLSTAGAKKIMVANLPDLGKLPATHNRPNSSILSSVTIAHNVGLAKSLNVSRLHLESHTQIIELDANALYQEAITNPSQIWFHQCDQWLSKQSYSLRSSRQVFVL